LKSYFIWFASYSRGYRHLTYPILRIFHLGERSSPIIQKVNAGAIMIIIGTVIARQQANDHCE